ncbi:MAG: SprT family zinc-dependent metalloprotease [Abitibacteriaceae bacterium]|nr:SprT family zinc-dependent metalloprotease [Abditibacteriaceae bacterium]MBV9867528.1 SprT family zinc-dependent metalloprotease [Abditibacteriaceae bacterium]
MENTDLQALYTELNATYFEGCLPPCRIAWSRQLTRAAGNIDVRQKTIKLSVPLLVDAFRVYSLFPTEYKVCGVLCDSSSLALREILKHEMIHLWLHVRGLPSGHTMEFRAKARAIGQPRTRHNITLPTPRSGWVYACPVCNNQFTRRRRYGHAVACSRCCKHFNGGQFDERFKLRGRKIIQKT